MGDTDGNVNHALLRGAQYLKGNRIPVSSSSGLTITAKLMYQPQSYGHLQELFQDNHLPEVASFKTMFESRNIMAESLGEVTNTVN